MKKNLKSNKYKHLDNGTTILSIIRKNGDEHNFTIDTNDFEKVKSKNWSVLNGDKVDKVFYAVSSKVINKKVIRILLHRFLFDEIPPNMVVDHINGNQYDNRKSNLRLITHSGNSENRKSAQINSKTGIRNVIWNKTSKKYQVVIKVNGKQKYFGLFSDIEEAEKAAIEARKKYMPHSKEGMFNEKI